MRLWCAIFGHGLNPPVVNSRGANAYRTCKRCDLFLLPDYFDGWRRASKRERELRLRAMRASLQDENVTSELTMNDEVETPRRRRRL